MTTNKNQITLDGINIIACESLFDEINEILSQYGLKFVDKTKSEDDKKTYEIINLNKKT